MRVSTIHSLCNRILALRPGLVGLRPDYGLLDEQEQQLLCREFSAVFGPDWDILSRRGWREGAHGAAEGARYFDRICDEMIDVDFLAGSARPFITAVGRSCLRYRSLLQDRNLVDFAHLQAWAEQVLRHDKIAARAAGTARRLVVDELPGHVPRPDAHTPQAGRGPPQHRGGWRRRPVDLSVRGASVANLLRFPIWFPGCRVLGLTTNYRSHRTIVGSVCQWMDTAAEWDGNGESFRHAKDIVANAPEDHPDYPAVISVQGQDSVDEACQLAELLRFLKHNGVIAGYGQTVLLLHSVKDGVSGPYH